MDKGRAARTEIVGQTTPVAPKEMERHWGRDHFAPVAVCSAHLPFEGPGCSGRHNIWPGGFSLARVSHLPRRDIGATVAGARARLSEHSPVPFLRIGHNLRLLIIPISTTVTLALVTLAFAIESAVAASKDQFRDQRRCGARSK